MTGPLLIIDDDPAIGRSLQLQLGAQGMAVNTATDAASGLAAARATRPRVVFLDLQLPDRDGLDLLDDLLALEPQPHVIVITGKQDMQATIRAIRGGAFDFIRKPLDIHDVRLALEKAARQRATSPSALALFDTPSPPREIVGRSRGIIDVLTQVARYSAMPANVLIEGESGTGKELVARAIHDAGAGGRPFVAVNCVALAAGVWESEMFGHEKGAFTGADRRHIGRLEAAADGTVFLDEIGDLPAAMQGKLLRVIQEREFERVGGAEAVPFRARILAATHRDVDAMIAAGDFREDLLHRLAVARIRIPPLRERKEDIPVLVQALLGRMKATFHREVRAISDSALARLVEYDWPGNVRELENVLMRSVASCHGDVLTDVELPEGGAQPARASGAPELAERRSWALRDVEARHIRDALFHFGWNISQTARALDVSPTTLRKKIRDYDIEDPRGRDSPGTDRA